MPQRKKPSRKTYKNTKASPHVGLFIFAAICLFVLIYWLSQPDSFSPVPKAAGKLKKAAGKVAKLEPFKQKSDTIKVPADKSSEKYQQAETKLEKGIYTALDKLHIPDQDIKRKKKDGDIFFTIPIDPSINDLTFANMIIKGETERLDGIFESGVEKGRRQYLTLIDRDTKQKYILELFYKRSETLIQTTSKVITIIIDDFGNSKGKLLNDFAKTNPAVCFAILPDTPYAEEAMKIAGQYGHESIIHAPMEPMNYPRENPGDHAIFIQNSPGEISRRMERFINQLPDCIGVNNHMGSLATSDEPAMLAVMQTLRKHNLIFVDSRTTSTSVAYKTAQKNLVPAFKRDIFLDEPDLSEANLIKKLSEINNMALTKSFIVAIMHCHTAAHLNYLNRFIAQAEQNGFELVPLSQLSAFRLPEIP